MSATLDQVQDFGEELKKTAQCPICLGLLNNPRSADCLHCFCKVCIETYIRSKKKPGCPMCKEPITKRSLKDVSDDHLRAIRKVQNVLLAANSDSAKINSERSEPLIIFSQQSQAVPKTPVRKTAKTAIRKWDPDTLSDGGGEEGIVENKGLLEALENGKLGSYKGKIKATISKGVEKEAEKEATKAASKAKEAAPISKSVIRNTRRSLSNEQEEKTKEAKTIAKVSKPVPRRTQHFSKEEEVRARKPSHEAVEKLKDQASSSKIPCPKPSSPLPHRAASPSLAPSPKTNQAKLDAKNRAMERLMAQSSGKLVRSPVTPKPLSSKHTFTTPKPGSAKPNTFTTPKHKVRLEKKNSPFSIRTPVPTPHTPIPVSSSESMKESPIGERRSKRSKVRPAIIEDDEDSQQTFQPPVQDSMMITLEDLSTSFDLNQPAAAIINSRLKKVPSVKELRSSVEECERNVFSFTGSPDVVIEIGKTDGKARAVQEEKADETEDSVQIVEINCEDYLDQNHDHQNHDHLNNLGDDSDEDLPSYDMLGDGHTTNEDEVWAREIERNSSINDEQVHPEPVPSKHDSLPANLTLAKNIPISTVLETPLLKPCHDDQPEFSPLTPSTSDRTSNCLTPAETPQCVTPGVITTVCVTPSFVTPVMLREDLTPQVLNQNNKVTPVLNPKSCVTPMFKAPITTVLETPAMRTNTVLETPSQRKPDDHSHTSEIKLALRLLPKKPADNFTPPEDEVPSLAHRLMSRKRSRTSFGGGENKKQKTEAPKPVVIIDSPEPTVHLNNRVIETPLQKPGTDDTVSGSTTGKEGSSFGALTNAPSPDKHVVEDAEEEAVEQFGSAFGDFMPEMPDSPVYDEHFGENVQTIPENSAGQNIITVHDEMPPSSPLFSLDPVTNEESQDSQNKISSFVKCIELEKSAEKSAEKTPLSLCRTVTSRNKTRDTVVEKRFDRTESKTSPKLTIEKDQSSTSYTIEVDNPQSSSKVTIRQEGDEMLSPQLMRSIYEDITNNSLNSLQEPQPGTYDFSVPTEPVIDLTKENPPFTIADDSKQDTPTIVKASVLIPSLPQESNSLDNCSLDESRFDENAYLKTFGIQDSNLCDETKLRILSQSSQGLEVITTVKDSQEDTLNDDEHLSVEDSTEKTKPDSKPADHSNNTFKSPHMLITAVPESLHHDIETPSKFKKPLSTSTQGTKSDTKSPKSWGSATKSPHGTNSKSASASKSPSVTTQDMVNIEKELLGLFSLEKRSQTQNPLNDLIVQEDAHKLKQDQELTIDDHIQDIDLVEEAQDFDEDTDATVMEVDDIIVTKDVYNDVTDDVTVIQIMEDTLTQHVSLVVNLAESQASPSSRTRRRTSEDFASPSSRTGRKSGIASQDSPSSRTRSKTRTPSSRTRSKTKSKEDGQPASVPRKKAQRALFKETETFAAVNDEEELSQAELFGLHSPASDIIISEESSTQKELFDANTVNDRNNSVAKMYEVDDVQNVAETPVSIPPPSSTMNDAQNQDVTIIDPELMDCDLDKTLTESQEKISVKEDDKENHSLPVPSLRRSKHNRNPPSISGATPNNASIAPHVSERSPIIPARKKSRRSRSSQPTIIKVLMSGGHPASDLKIVHRLGFLFSHNKGITMSILTVWSDSVTHVIFPHHKNLECQRTIKYLQGVAGGKWMLSLEWIKQCLESKSLVSEIPYEMRGCNYDPMSGGPRNSRTAHLLKQPALFGNLSIFFVGRIIVIPKETLSQLLEQVGVTITPDQTFGTTQLTNPTKATPMIDEACTSAEDAARQYGEILTVEWALRCIASFRVLPIDSSQSSGGDSCCTEHTG